MAQVLDLLADLHIASGGDGLGVPGGRRGNDGSTTVMGDLSYL